MSLPFKSQHEKDRTLDDIAVKAIDSPEKARSAVNWITDAFNGFFRNSLLAADGRIDNTLGTRLNDFGKMSEPVLPGMGKQGFSRETLAIASLLSGRLAPEEDDPDIVEAVTHPELGLHALLQLIAHSHAQHRSAPHTLSNLAVLSGDVYSTNSFGLASQRLNQLDWDTDRINDGTPSRKKVLALRIDDLQVATLENDCLKLRTTLEGIDGRYAALLDNEVNITFQRVSLGKAGNPLNDLAMEKHLLMYIAQLPRDQDLDSLKQTLALIRSPMDIMRLPVRAE